MQSDVTLRHYFQLFRGLRHLTYEKSYRILSEHTFRPKNCCWMEEVQNYGKILFIKNIAAIGWWGRNASPSSPPPPPDSPLGIPLCLCLWQCWWNTLITITEYSSTALVLEYSFSEYSCSKYLISRSRPTPPKSTRTRSKNQSNTRVAYFDFYHTYRPSAYNRNFRRDLLKSSVKVNDDYKELKTRVQSGNIHLD